MRMRQIINYLLAVFSLCGFISCGNDDGPADPESAIVENIMQNLSDVYPEGLPKQIGDYKIELDANGLVSKIVSDNRCVTFDYSNAGARSGNYAVRMRIDGCGDIGDEGYMVLNLRVNNEGLVTYCFEEEYYDGKCTTQEWWFKYSYKHLVWLKRSEGNNEVTTISYNRNDITNVKMTSDNPENTYESYISYGNSSIANKYGIMLFDLCFDIDMDEMKYAGYAGFLGKATSHLPMKITSDDGIDAMLEWHFDGNGCPISVTREEYGSINFNW